MIKLKERQEFSEIPHVELTYKYWLNTWGGFYNKENKDIHHFEEGEYIFNTKEEREEYIKKLQTVAVSSNKLDEYATLMIDCTEGYTLVNPLILHLIVEHKETKHKRHILHTLYKNHDIDTLLYYISYKCPIEKILGDEINNYNVITSFITGSINTTEFTKELIDNRI